MKKFADFETVKGKIDIKKIYIDTYSKKGSEAYEIVKAEFDNV